MPKRTVFFVTPELQQALDDLSANDPRSRLDPFRTFILRWRREGRSYRAIQRILAEECKVPVSIAMLFKFVKSRSKPRKAQPPLELEMEQRTLAAPAAIPRTRQLGPDAYAEARERMRRVKEAPLASQPSKVFYVPEEDLDFTKPLRMITRPNKEK